MKFYRFVSVSIDNSDCMVYILFTKVNCIVGYWICKGEPPGTGAKMAKILVGTCGYGYNEWVGPVYPVGTKTEGFLPLYAGMFGTVELDYAYYAMPKAAQLAKMLEAAGPDLTFSIKAHESLTHKVNPEAWERDAKTYLEALEPLRAAGRLEAVLFQFPHSFHYEADNRRYLDKLLAFFKDVPSAVEFRNAGWINDRVIEDLRKRGVALASLDMPDLQGLPPALDVLTGSFAYIRLHGRNKAAWWGSNSAARYDYLYSEQELERWADRIRRIVIKADRILAYFNNHARGQAIKNGQMLTKILDKAGLFSD
jgi:uncharacterized protein YecE (DUF72 family)